MPFYVSSVSTRKGAREVNSLNPVFASNDVGGLLVQVVSAIAVLNTTVTAIGSAVMSANASAVTFSALSGVTFGTTVSPTNLQA